MSSNPISIQMLFSANGKRQREKEGAAALSGLRGLTEEKLQTLIAEAMAARDTRIEEALARFAETDSEAASLLQGLINELNTFQRRPILDEGVVGKLSRAAEQLRLSLDEGVVDKLHDAAAKMWRMGNR